MAGEGSFDLAKLFSNQGYECIVETIFFQMDPTTLALCRLVSKSWKALIDNRKSLLICQLKQLTKVKLAYPEAKVWYKLRRILEDQRKMSVLERFPEFKQLLVDLERMGTTNDFKTIVVLLKDYTKHQIVPVGKLQDKRISRSPLHFAIENGNQDFVKILLRSTNFDFQPSIHFNGQIVATYLGLAIHDQTIVELFLDYAIAKGINLNIPDGQGRTAFHYACMHGTLEVVKLFLEKVEKEFLGLNMLDREGHSPLHLACIGNKPKNIQYLLTLSLPFDANAMDRNGWTLLHLAAKHGHDKVFQVVLEASLEHEINVNAFDSENKTPFTIACMNGCLEVAKLMIFQSREYQIDLNLLDFQGNSAIHYAFENGHLDIVRVIFDEAKDKDINLNQEGDIFRELFIPIFNTVNSKGCLVFGRRPELWDPMKITSAIFFMPAILFQVRSIRIMLYTMLLMSSLILLYPKRLYLDLLFQITGVSYFYVEGQCYNFSFIDWLEYFLRPQCTGFGFINILHSMYVWYYLRLFPWLIYLISLTTKSKTIWKTHYRHYYSFRKMVYSVNRMIDIIYYRLFLSLLDMFPFFVSQSVGLVVGLGIICVLSSFYPHFHIIQIIITFTIALIGTVSFLKPE